MTDRPAKSAAEIIRAIGCKHLSLHRCAGHGYWYFVFDDLDSGGKRYETESIYCVRLNDMALAKWIEYGKSFAARMEQEQ